MDFPAYIRSLDDEVEAAVAKAAKLFDEEPRTIKAWLYRERTPRPETARKIVAASKGKLSFASIYSEPRA